MDGATLLLPRQLVFPHSVRICGISSHDPWHCITSHQGAGGRWVLVRQRSKADGRSVTLRLKDKGKKALARDPFEVLVRAVDALDAEEQTAMHDALHQVLTTVAAGVVRRRFGVCRDCAYRGEICRTSMSANQSVLECLLFSVRIDPKDAGLLCVHYESKDEKRRGAGLRMSSPLRKDP
jgi:hypothetical protein